MYQHFIYILLLNSVYFPSNFTWDIWDDTSQVETALFAMSFKEPLSSVPPEFVSASCQPDLVLFTLPLKFKNA